MVLLSRALGQRGWVDMRIGRAILVLDPLPEPLGAVGKSVGVEPPGILVERFVQMLGSEDRHVAMEQGEGRGGLAGRFTAVHHEVDCRSQTGAVCAALQ